MMKHLPAKAKAKARLAAIMGAPLLIPSELEGGKLVTIYPHCDRAALERFNRNWDTAITEESAYNFVVSERHKVVD